MAKHVYALVSADGSILQTTEPRDTAPAHVNFCVWQQVPEDAPVHNPELHETHSPEFRMVGHRVHRIWKIRRKS
jgi:hypothetical protein